MSAAAERLGHALPCRITRHSLALERLEPRLLLDATTVIQQMVDAIDQTDYTGYLADLTQWTDRNCYTPNLGLAEAYIVGELEAIGLQVELQTFQMPSMTPLAWNGGQDWAPVSNIIATIPGTVTPEQEYVLCGHYDSIAVHPDDYDDAFAMVIAMLSPSTPAPGADDNGSGAAAVLESARVMSQYPFESTIKFIFWGAEEEGLVGSDYYTKYAYYEDPDVENPVADPDDIRGAINYDMIAYWDYDPLTGEDLDVISYTGPTYGIDTYPNIMWIIESSNPDLTPEQVQYVLASLIAAIPPPPAPSVDSSTLTSTFVDAATTYDTGLSINLIEGGTSDDWWLLGASDHFNFWWYGWPALLCIEDLVYGIDPITGYPYSTVTSPFYHSSSDTLANCNALDMATSATKTGVATIAEMAGVRVGWYGGDFEDGLLSPADETDGDVTVVATSAENNATQLAESSSASLSQRLVVPVDETALQFDFRFVDLGDGDFLTLEFEGVELLRRVGQDVADTDWHAAGIDMSSYAGQPGTLSFVLNSQGTANAVCQVDEITFAAVPSFPPASFPFSEDWEAGTFAECWEAVEGTEGRIQVTSDNGPYGGTYHVTLDDTTGNGAFSTNQLVLHIDLEGQAGVELAFANREWWDEDHSEDCVELSVDGGSTWHEVVALTGAASTQTYTERAYDLDALGLTYSSDTLIRFQQRDNYPISGGDGMAFDNVEVRQGPVPTAFPFSEDWESGTFSTCWEVIEGTEGRLQVTSDNGPYGGAYHVALDDAVGNSAYSTNQLILHIDLEGQAGVELAFANREWWDEDHSEDCVELSVDGGSTWHEVVALTGAASTQTYTERLYDLDALGLTYSSDTLIRFQQRDNYPIASGDGMALDNIQVCQGPVPAAFPFTEDWESGTFATCWEVNEGTEGRVQVTSDNGPYGGTYHVTLDDTVGNSVHSTNQLILHIDLEGQSGVELAFANREWWDEDHAEDCVEISVDDGATWHQVAALTGANSTQTYTERLYELDTLGLTYTSDTLIRFQQRDNYPISGGDGVALDNIEVRQAPVPAGFPFSEDWESGTFAICWEVIEGSEGRVQVTSGNGPYAGTYHVTLDDTTGNGVHSTNQLVLHVGLDGQSNVELAFANREWWDEDHAEDRVEISVDDGATWHQVISLTGSNSTETYTERACDLDSLGLTYSADTLIRFQQGDNYPISGGDGMAFDNIAVRVAVTSPPPDGGSRGLLESTGETEQQPEATSRAFGAAMFRVPVSASTERAMRRWSALYALPGRFAAGRAAGLLWEFDAELGVPDPIAAATQILDEDSCGGLLLADPAKDWLLAGLKDS